MGTKALSRDKQKEMLGYVSELRKGKSLQVTQEMLNIGEREDTNSLRRSLIKRENQTAWYCCILQRHGSKLQVLQGYDFQPIIYILLEHSSV